MQHADHVMCLTHHSCWVNVGSFAVEGSPQMMGWRAIPSQKYVDIPFAVGNVFAGANCDHGCVSSARASMYLEPVAVKTAS